MNQQRKLFSLAPVLVLVALAGGCVTQSRERAQEQAAYLAGQNAALRQQQLDQTPSVTVIGPVQNERVPWVEGLTLAQAIATADYLDSRTPKKITITRNGDSASLDPDVLLKGVAIPLEPGDVVEIEP